MTIRKATQADISLLHELDAHISEQELATIIGLGRVYVAEKNGCLAGWLRYNLFWDNTPFMNMLFMLSEYRGNKHGTNLIAFW